MAKVAGKRMMIRVSPVVEERMREQAALLGLAPSQYATMIVAQQTLTVQQATAALPELLERMAAAAPDVDTDA